MVYFTTIPMLYIQFDIHNNNVHLMKFEYLVFSEGVFHLLRGEEMMMYTGITDLTLTSPFTHHPTQPVLMYCV